jgi:hypothetical protein
MTWKEKDRPKETPNFLLSDAKGGESLGWDKIFAKPYTNRGIQNLFSKKVAERREHVE